MQGLTPYNLKIVAEVLGGGAYPLHLLELLGRNPLIVDLGANIGSFSLAALTLRKDAQLVAVEPDPFNVTALRNNLAATNAEVQQVAIGTYTGVTNLFLGDQDAVTNSTFLGEMASGVQKVTVPCQSASEFFDNIAQEHGPISLLKCDIEGGEWHLLSLPSEVLEAIPVIFLEYHSASFMECFLPIILSSHVIYSGSVRFPHRGELAFIHKDLISPKQASYEIRDKPRN